MKIKEIQKLVNAGYTKEEIEKMDSGDSEKKDKEIKKEKKKEKKDLTLKSFVKSILDEEEEKESKKDKKDKNEKSEVSEKDILKAFQIMKKRGDDLIERVKTLETEEDRETEKLSEDEEEALST